MMDILDKVVQRIKWYENVLGLKEGLGTACEEGSCQVKWESYIWTTSDMTLWVMLTIFIFTQYSRCKKPLKTFVKGRDMLDLCFLKGQCGC